MRALTIFDHCIASQIAKITLCSHVDALFLDLRINLVEAGGTCRRRIIAPAQDQDADASLQAAERLGRLANAHAQQHLLQCRRQVPHAILVIADQLGAKFPRARTRWGVWTRLAGRG